MCMRDSSIYTVGHSTRTLEELVILLKNNNVKHLIDVRAFPGSRKYPQFNHDNLECELPESGIKYTHMRALGGRRKEDETINRSSNIFWENKSFRNYADYALSLNFQHALSDLKSFAEYENCAIICSEAVWWRCHRRIIADYLLADGYEVRHIMGKNKTVPANLTKGARIIDPKHIFYDQIED